jgi:hypothetical protein
MKPVRKGLQDLKYVGDNKMKTKIKLRKIRFIAPLVIILSGISLITSFWAQATNSAGSNNKVIKPIDIEMKCHVELVGGGEAISFTNTPYRSIKELTPVLIKQKVKLNNDSSARAIYKVKECVPLKDKLKGRRAQQLFLDTPQ